MVFQQRDTCLTGLENIQNFILYGPSGTGKYSEALKIIEKYSPSYLKYEKKMIINSSKNEHIIKISDIHYEIDLENLTCNSKILLNDIYNNMLVYNISFFLSLPRPSVRPSVQ